MTPGDKNELNCGIHAERTYGLVQSASPRCSGRSIHKIAALVTSARSYHRLVAGGRQNKLCDVSSPFIPLHKVTDAPSASSLVANAKPSSRQFCT